MAKKKRPEERRLVFRSPDFYEDVDEKERKFLRCVACGKKKVDWIALVVDQTTDGDTVGLGLHDACFGSARRAA